MSWTIVLNLLEVRIKHDYEERVYQVLQYSNATIMALSLIAMLYIAWATREEVTWTIHRNNLTFYFRTGLYVFGVANMVYTSLNLYNDFSCKDGLNILLNISQFLFTAGQIMFHNYFYQAKLPSRGWLMQICLAHILGTNLSLWIGTICKEVYTPEPKNTSDCSPINMGHSEKYFYPLFVEYLLLVAGMVYELWIDLKIPKDRIRGARHDWINNAYQEQLSGTTEVSLPVRLVSEGRRRTFSPSLALSLVLGTAFGAIFFSSMLGAYDSSWKGKQRHRSLYNNFIIANICFYCTQLIACYVIKVCGQSQPANSKRKSFNVDDSLLYFGLAGIILWEGVHFYYLFFEEAEEPIHFVHGLLGAIQDVVQTVILVSVRRLLSREDKNAQTISNFSLFLLATNFAFWIQNSFYMEQQLHNPGEDEHTDGEKNLLSKLQVFAYILNPIIIFFRFHSATCCYQMWVIFSRPVLNEN
ncbi:uncharacterized protein LOC114523511 [Dendronephthya gigantea]|uniref:uncharacterized protein LOC114523511 n=1 Tax=Dendronephthya gigantea TaxID=151771 RepID=UPI00106CE843|nr:uncharacterized protein LOC114523511 [Dendronephthya gigantea]